MSTLQDVLKIYCVRPETVAGIALATDGIKADSKIGMVSIAPLTSDPFSIMVSGADMGTTVKYHGVPENVYRSLALSPKAALERITDILDERGIHTLVAHSAFRFVRDKVFDQKLILQRVSFIDTALMHKAIRNWCDQLNMASNLLDLQSRIRSKAGANTIKMEMLLELYCGRENVDLNLVTQESPYVPENKAKAARDVFEKQLEAELCI